MSLYSTGIDRNAGSAFRRRSRQAGALSRLHRTLERGTRYDKTLNTHVALNQTHRDRIQREVEAIA